MTNDIDGAITCVLNGKLKEIVQHYRLPQSLINNIAEFTTNQQIYMEFDAKNESPVPFE